MALARTVPAIATVSIWRPAPTCDVRRLCQPFHPHSHTLAALLHYHTLSYCPTILVTAAYHLLRSLPSCIATISHARRTRHYSNVASFHHNSRPTFIGCPLSLSHRPVPPPQPNPAPVTYFMSYTANTKCPPPAIVFCKSLPSSYIYCSRSNIQPPPVNIT